MSAIPEFDDGERWVVESTLKERYGKIVSVQLADVELKLAAEDAQLTACPTLYWEERGAGFVVAKVGEGRYRSMFFYADDPLEEQFGAGKPVYEDLFECVTAVLRVQADHEKERKGAHSGRTAQDLTDAP